jgi:fluoroquinolone transport system ATP-binding protein
MHDADELCDHVAFMVQGSIALIDSPKNLKQRYGQRVLSVEYEDQGIKIRDFNMDQLADNSSFQQILNSHYVRSMHSKEASLEDIFIASTGQQLNA